MQTPEQAAAEVVLLTRQHHYLQKELGGTLISAPIELAGRNLSILDVGCGSGRLEYDHRHGFH
jgi:2-polyprenyl-3-methyl-5-hydroxy-6-metoxy-1,4-benzoquinol methylase